jgi:peptidoglycan/xylan/chitin deacetylase (PgdA/CDA1 family)
MNIAKALEKTLITSVTFDDISPAYLLANKFRSLLSFLDQICVSCTFFVVAGKSPFDTGFKSCLKDAISSGHEMSLHGYMHSRNEFGYLAVPPSGIFPPFSIPMPSFPLPSFSKQKKSIEKAEKVLIELTGIKPLGFRAPGYLYNNQTLRVLSRMGYKYDSSKTLFKPVYAGNLRALLSRNCKPQKVYDLMEIPVTGDYTYDLNSSNFSYMIQMALRDFQLIASRDGVFVINIHPNRSDTILLTKFLQVLVKALHKKTDFSRLVDINL